jgi:MFS family permease
MTETPAVSASSLRGRDDWREMLGAGIQFIWKNKILLVMISLDLFAVLLGGAVYLLPIFATDILQVGATGFGWLRAAPAVGAFCMAVALIYLPPMRHAGRNLLLSVAGFGVATIIFGLSTSFWLSFAMLFLTGAFDNISMVIRHTLQQLLTPDPMRGRVSAVTSVFVGASNELGGLESGLVAHWFGPVFSVVSGGIGTILVVLGTAAASPELRAFGALHEAKPLEEEDEKAAAPSRPAALAPDAKGADD